MFVSGLTRSIYVLVRCSDMWQWLNIFVLQLEIISLSSTTLWLKRYTLPVMLLKHRSELNKKCMHTFVLLIDEETCNYDAVGRRRIQKRVKPFLIWRA
jgi:hypothetical protein